MAGPVLERTSCTSSLCQFRAPQSKPLALLSDGRKPHLAFLRSFLSLPAWEACCFNATMESSNLPFASDAVARRILTYVQIAYPIILLFVYLIAFTISSISTARNDNDTPEPELFGSVDGVTCF